MRTHTPTPSTAEPRSRAHLIGDDMARWFAAQGWAAAPRVGSVPRAFVDELRLSKVTIRRVWHTPLVLTRTVDAPQPTRHVWLQTQGAARIDDSTGSVHQLRTQSAIAWADPAVSRLTASQPTARIEIESRGFTGLRIQADTYTHLDGRTGGPLTAWSCLAGTVNMLLNADTPLDDRSARLFALALDAMTDAVTPPAVGAGPRPRRNDLVQEARRLLSEHASDPSYTVQRAAEELGVTRSHLTRAFGREGDSPRQFLRTQRVSRARHLLAIDPDTDLSTVAHQSGIPSARALRESLRANAREDARSGDA